MRRPLRFLAAAACAAMRLGAQQAAPITIPDAVSCTKCNIVTRPVATLGTADGPGSLSGGLPTVRVDGRGRYWVIQEGELPFVYDANGRFLQAVGHKGNGPGEFENVNGALAVTGDSMSVWDDNRLTVVDPSLVPRRIVRREPGWSLSAIAAWPTSVLLVRTAWRREATWQMMARGSMEGDAVRIQSGFGTTYEGIAAIEQHRADVSLVMSGRFWAVESATYALRDWDLASGRSREFQRDAALFKNPPATGPKPAAAHVVQDSDGLVWVAVLVQAPTWRDAIPKGGGEVSVKQIAWEKYYRTVVEVIDPKSARVVTRKPLDQIVLGFLPGNRAALYSVDADGIPRIQIIEMQTRD